MTAFYKMSFAWRNENTPVNAAGKIGDWEGDTTGDVCMSSGISPSVWKTKNASPPSPNFIGKSTFLLFTLNSTYIVTNVLVSGNGSQYLLLRGKQKRELAEPDVEGRARQVAILLLYNDNINRPGQRSLH